MTAGKPSSAFTLALHPTAHGFSWILFSGPSAPYTWSVVDAPSDKNATCMRKIERLLRRYPPEAIVLEAYEPPHSKRSDRIVRLCRSIAALATDQSIEVAVYRRGDVQACFASVGAQTRYEIAQAVARHVEALRPRLPRGRRAWESDPKRLGLFTAAALALTHFRLGASNLFDALL